MFLKKKWGGERNLVKTGKFSCANFFLAHDFFFSEGKCENKRWAPSENKQNHVEAIFTCARDRFPWLFWSLQELHRSSSALFVLLSNVFSLSLCSRKAGWFPPTPWTHFIKGVFKINIPQKESFPTSCVQRKFNILYFVIFTEMICTVLYFHKHLRLIKKKGSFLYFLLFFEPVTELTAEGFYFISAILKLLFG